MLIKLSLILHLEIYVFEILVLNLSVIKNIMKKYILVLLPILFVSFVIFAFDIETNPSNITLYMKKINIASD
jgi:hypothetical protein